MNIIYCDHAATTPVKEEVLNEMIPYFSMNYGNPSSIYSIGRRSKKALDTARTRVAKAIGADEKEIYFTSCGSESDNLAIKGIAKANNEKGKHIITSKIEHHAVLNTCKTLEKEGYEITYLNVNEKGLVDLEQLKNSIREDTILITIMFANNEIGTIQPIKEISEIAHKSNIIFHTDAVQAVGNVKIDVNELGIDALSMSAHKFYGPKGVGALYIKNGIEVEKFINGGHQEKDRRAGTENVAGIVALAKALEITLSDFEEKEKRILELREYLIDEVFKRVPYVKLNGHRTKRIPANANFSFRFIEGESMLLALDMYGICASSGSACTSGSLDPSHVLLAIGLPHEIAHGSLRVSLSQYSTKEEVDYFLDIIPNIIDNLRQMSPLYEDFIKNEEV